MLELRMGENIPSSKKATLLSRKNQMKKQSIYYWHYYYHHYTIATNTFALDVFDGAHYSSQRVAASAKFLAFSLGVRELDQAVGLGQ